MKIKSFYNAYYKNTDTIILTKSASNNYFKERIPYIESRELWLKSVQLASLQVVDSQHLLR